MLNQLKGQVIQYCNVPKDITATVHMYTYTQHIRTYIRICTYTQQDDSGVATILGLAYMQ